MTGIQSQQTIFELYKYSKNKYCHKENGFKDRVCYTMNENFWFQNETFTIWKMVYSVVLKTAQHQPHFENKFFLWHIKSTFRTKVSSSDSVMFSYNCNICFFHLLQPCLCNSSNVFMMKTSRIIKNQTGSVGCFVYSVLSSWLKQSVHHLEVSYYSQV